MKAILFLNFRVSLAIAIFYLVYRLLLSKDTFFVRNRFYLLGTLLISFLSPLLKIQTTAIGTIPRQIFLPYGVNTEIIGVPGINGWLLFTEIALGLYLTGVIIGFVRLIWAYHHVIHIVMTSERRPLHELILVITQLSVAPFSWLKWLVISKEQIHQMDFKNIVQHESIHSRQYHSVDLFLAEFLLVFQWFNPFAWWFKKSIMENHEFIVDQVILRDGMDAQKYQYSLLNLSTGGSQLSVVSYFSANLLKKRILMMNKSKTPRWYGLKNGMVLVSIAIVVALTATFETKVHAQKSDSTPMIIIDGKKSDKAAMDKINPESIQSVNVLKDSSAFPKYGKAGSNGVVEVTTRVSTKNETVTIKNVEVVGYGPQQKLSDAHPLIIVDGKVVTQAEFELIKPNDIKSVEVMKDPSSCAQYGEKGKDGVVKITLVKAKS